MIEKTVFRDSGNIYFVTEDGYTMCADHVSENEFFFYISTLIGATEKEEFYEKGHHLHVKNVIYSAMPCKNTDCKKEGSHYSHVGVAFTTDTTITTYFLSLNQIMELTKNDGFGIHYSF